MQDGSQGSGDPAQPRRPVLPPGVSKRSRLTRRKQSRSSGQEAAQHSDQLEEEPAEEPIGSVLLEPTESLQLEELLRALPVYLSAAQLARLLWSTSYWTIFMAQLVQHSAVGDAVTDLFNRLRTSRQGDLANDAPALLRLSSMTASMSREMSRKILPFSIVAKSISWLMQRVPDRVWVSERKQRNLVSKSVATNVLDEMLLCRPPPSFEVHSQVGCTYACISLCARS